MILYIIYYLYIYIFYTLYYILFIIYIYIYIRYFILYIKYIILYIIYYIFYILYYILYILYYILYILYYIIYIEIEQSKYGFYPKVDKNMPISSRCSLIDPRINHALSMKPYYLGLLKSYTQKTIPKERDSLTID